MARTLGGNILELLAATGAHGALELGTKTLLYPMMAKREAQQQVLRSLLPTMGTGSSDEQEAAAKTIEDISGVSWPRRNLEGYVPEGTAPTPGNILSASEMAQRGEGTFNAASAPNALVRAIPSLEALKAKMFQGLSPEEQKTAAFPKDATLQATLLKAAMDRASRESENALNRESREAMSKDRLDMQQQLLMSNQDFKRMYLQNTINNQNMMHMFMGERLESSARGQLDKALKNVTDIIKDPMAKPESIQSAVDKYNALHGSIIGKYPDLGGYFTPLDVQMSEPGLIGKMLGTKPKPVGVKAKETPIATTLTFPRRVKVNGQETIVNSQDEYDALKKGLQK